MFEKVRNAPSNLKYSSTLTSLAIIRRLWLQIEWVNRQNIVAFNVSFKSTILAYPL